jgi:hypothetical protein
MGMHTSRSRFGEPATDLATSLGRLLVSSAQLRHLLGELTSDGAEIWSPGDALTNWVDYTRHLLEVHDRILAASATMRFSGSSGEHLTISGMDGVRVPADAAYITTLARRMDRHSRLGRLMLGVAPAAETPQAVAV